MRRFGFRVLILATVVGVASAAAAEDGSAADPPPSLEYRPQRVVIPEPKAPTPAPPVTIFRGGHRQLRHRDRVVSTGRVDVAVDADGNFYVLDAGNNRVQMFDSFSNFKFACGSRGIHGGEFRTPGRSRVDSHQGGLPLLLRRRHRQPPGSDLRELEKQTGKARRSASTAGAASAAATATSSIPRDFVAGR